MRRPLLVCVLLTSCLLTLLPFASATWSANVSGLASARTTTVNPGHAPSVGVSGNTVRLVWEPSTLASSAPVTGYLVKRYDAAGTEQVVGSGSCAATVGTTTCSETAVPDGSWRYSVTPVHHSWRGAESVTSPAEVAAAPSTTVTFPSVGTPYNDAGFTAGCGTGTTGEVCGTVADAGSGVTRVQVSLQRGTGSYWGGTGFTSDTEVLLDATGTTAWSYGFDPTAFPSDGRYTLRVRAVNGAGIVGVASSTFTVDRTPPATPTIDSAPPSPTASAAATFGFSNAEAGVGFQCRLDGSAWAGCTSPTSYSGLADGSHTFEVRSMDAAGNLGNARSHTWVVDTVAPTAAVTFPIHGSLYNNSGFTAGCGTASTGDVCGTSADTGGTEVAQVQVSLQQGTGNYWNGTGFTSSGEVLLTATGTANWSYAFGASSFPAEGQYTLRARVTDAAGNTTTTSSTFTIDRTPPVSPTITSGPPNPSNSSSATFGFTNAEAGVGFECRLDGSAWASCVSPRSYSGLGQGSHTFEVRSVDAAGNIGDATTRTWVVDTVAPTAAVTFPVHGSSYSNSGFTAGCGTASTGDVCGTSADSGTGVTVVQVSLQQGTGSYWNGTGFTSSTEVLLDAAGTTSWSLPFSATSFPDDGQYTLRARVTDAAGNTTTTSSTFTIDRTSPTGVDVQATNGTRLVSTADEGDTLTLTYSERIAPGSVLAGWSGAQTNVVMRLNDVRTGSTPLNDTITISNAADSLQLPLGTVDLGRTDYTNKSISLPSTMTQVGNTIRIVLGARPNGTGAADTALGTGTLTWTPASGATDLVGNPAATTAVTESGATDSDF